MHEAIGIQILLRDKLGHAVIFASDARQFSTNWCQINKKISLHAEQTYSTQSFIFYPLTNSIRYYGKRLFKGRVTYSCKSSLRNAVNYRTENIYTYMISNLSLHKKKQNWIPENNIFYDSTLQVLELLNEKSSIEKSVSFVLQIHVEANIHKYDIILE